MAKRKASLAKQLQGAYETEAHNKRIQEQLEKSISGQMDKAKKYGKYKSIAKPLIDMALSTAFPVAGAGGALSQIGRLSGAALGTDVLYDTIFGDLLGMQADPSQIRATGAKRYGKKAASRMRGEFDKSISKNMGDRLLEAGVSGASTWAMGKFMDKINKGSGGTPTTQTINPETGAIEAKPLRLETKPFEPSSSRMNVQQRLSSRPTYEAPKGAGYSSEAGTFDKYGTSIVTPSAGDISAGTIFAKPDIQTPQMTTNILQYPESHHFGKSASKNTYSRMGTWHFY